MPGLDFKKLKAGNIPEVKILFPAALLVNFGELSLLRPGTIQTPSEILGEGGGIGLIG